MSTTDDRQWTAVGEQAGAARAGETMWSGPFLKPGERVTVVPIVCLQEAQHRATEARQDHREAEQREALLRTEAEATHELLAHFRAERKRLREALLAARQDILKVNAALQGYCAREAIGRIDAALSSKTDA